MKTTRLVFCLILLALSLNLQAKDEFIVYVTYKSVNDTTGSFKIKFKNYTQTDYVVNPKLFDIVIDDYTNQRLVYVQGSRYMNYRESYCIDAEFKLLPSKQTTEVVVEFNKSIWTVESKRDYFHIYIDLFKQEQVNSLKQKVNSHEYYRNGYTFEVYSIKTKGTKKSKPYIWESEYEEFKPFKPCNE